MNTCRLAGGATLVALTAGSLRAQRVDDARAGVARAPIVQQDTASIGTDLRSPPAPAPGNPLLPATWRRSKRKYAKYTKDVRDQANGEAEFKDIARRVARAHFPGKLPDGPWSYYEAMRDYLESGSYSLSPSDAGPVVPETDSTTYNGRLWLLEQQTHATPADALAAYQQNAIKPEFEWSWRNAQLQFDLFKRATGKRNDAYQSGIQDLTVIGMNHLLSMVDAFATLRLQVRRETNGATTVGASMRW
jgi:hypothetical protein